MTPSADTADPAGPPLRAVAGRRLRVAVFSPSFQDPENRKHLVALGRHLDVTLYAPDVWELPADDFRVGGLAESDYASQHIHPLPPVRPLGRHIPVYGLRSFSFGFRRLPPDVIHFDHDPWAPIFWQAVLAGRLFAPQASVVMCPKKNTYRHHDGAMGRLKLGMAQAGLRHVDFLMPASRMARDLYRDRFAVPEERMRVMTLMPVDVDAFSPSGEPGSLQDPPVIGFSGRFHPQKGLADLVEAAERLHAAGRPVRVRAVGDGQQMADLRELARTRPWLELPGSVRLADVASFLRDVDVFVSPARIEPDHQEHDGHAILQALACGVPVIGARSGIIPELLADGVGVLVAPERPDELAEALLALLDDAPRRAALARRGREEAVARYSMEVVSAAKARVYEELVAASGGRRDDGRYLARP
jgi:glycosyltransferase involved in cell wall biosynthesis